MSALLNRLLAGSALTLGALLLGFASGGVAAMDDDLAAATEPAPQVREVLIEERVAPVPVPADEDCPVDREPLRLRLGREL